MVDHANQRRIIKASPQRCFDMVSEPSTPGAYMLSEGKKVSRKDLNKHFNKSDRVDRIFNDIIRWEK